MLHKEREKVMNRKVNTSKVQTETQKKCRELKEPDGEEEEDADL